MTSIPALLTYKLACIVSGVLICYFGYRLFVLGIFRGAGDLDSSFKNTRLILKKAAPGTFFALFGALVVGATVWMGLELNEPASVSPAGAGQEARTVTRGGRGAGNDASEDRARLDARRTEARRTVSDLNRFPSLLRPDVPVETLSDVKQAIRESKVALIQSVWSSDWGEVGALRRWLDQNQPAAVPPEFRPVAELYEHGSPKENSP